jgi:RNA polymerase sigma factor (sigma-70 family)
MTDVGDVELLRNYVRQGSEEAFAALVQRHINLVYSVALRRVGIAAQAEEITQAVFIILAHKAKGLRTDTVLEGWLYEVTRLTTSGFLRGERRRQAREQEAYMQSTLDEPNPVSVWNQISPLLDDAMSRLGKKDRDAVILRFFKGKNLSEVASTLNVTEAAAQRRVHRALEKLRRYFNKRGVSPTMAIMAGELSVNSVHAAPVALAKTVTAAAVAKGSSAAASTLILVKGTMKTMTWLKLKFALGLTAAALLAIGTATVAFSQSQPTVYSFLANPPIISNVAIEMETDFHEFATDHKPTPWKSPPTQSVSYAIDGKNYRTDIDGNRMGRYDDVLWTHTGEQTTRFNLKWNPVNDVANPTNMGSYTFIHMVDSIKLNVNQLLTFGITTKPKNTAWNSNKKQYMFEGENGNKHTADFVETDGLPVTATIRNVTTGTVEETVVYHYSPLLFGGRLPSEFICYAGSTVSEDHKFRIVRIKSMEISKQHLLLADFDPGKLYTSTNANYVPLFYSNNIVYWTDRRGKATPVKQPEKTPVCDSRSREEDEII